MKVGNNQHVWNRGLWRAKVSTKSGQVRSGQVCWTCPAVCWATFSTKFGSIILLFLVKIIYYLAIKSFVRTLSCGASHLEFPIGTKKFYIWSCIKEYSFNVWNQCLSPLSEFKSRWGRGEQHYVIKFVSDLRQVGGFLRFTPPIKLTATI